MSNPEINFEYTLRNFYTDDYSSPSLSGNLKVLNGEFSNGNYINLIESPSNLTFSYSQTSQEKNTLTGSWNLYDFNDLNIDIESESFKLNLTDDNNNKELFINIDGLNTSSTIPIRDKNLNLSDENNIYITPYGSENLNLSTLNGKDIIILGGAIGNFAVSLGNKNLTLNTSEGISHNNKRNNVVL